MTANELATLLDGREYDHERFVKDMVMGETLKERGVMRQDIRDAMDEYDKRRTEEWKA